MPSRAPPTASAIALFGNAKKLDGLMRCGVYRWFMDPESRSIFPTDTHEAHAHEVVAAARAVFAKHGPGSRAAEIVNTLLAESTEFQQLWEEHEVATTHHRVKTLIHPEVGQMELQCQHLYDFDQGQSLLVFTATPGTESYDKLQLLAVIGAQQLIADGDELSTDRS